MCAPCRLKGSSASRQRNRTSDGTERPSRNATHSHLLLQSFPACLVPPRMRNWPLSVSPCPVPAVPSP
jgi:hypothetical protein